MTASLPQPDDRTLRDFLLGTLPSDRAKEVVDWLGSDPAAADALQRLPAEDPLTAALADPSTAEPIPTPLLARLVQSVRQALESGNIPLSTSTPPFPAALERLSLAESRGVEVPATPLPVQLRGYRVVGELGRGGMGVVLEAEDERLRRRVALKVMNPERAQDATARARFLREARAAAAIEQENVVPIHHVDEDGGVPFIVMPLLQGESLHSRLKREGRLPSPEVIRLGREVATGLAAAHARGLIHRDIKPGNIWLDAGTGRARILDFGLARPGDGTDGLTSSGMIVGTPAYMAPEQVDGMPADARSDLFSLGATLYQCAVGQLPFTGPTLTAILGAVTSHHPPPLDQIDPMIPAGLSALVTRLLAKKPSARPVSAQAVAAELAALADRLPVSSPPPPPVGGSSAVAATTTGQRSPVVTTITETPARKASGKRGYAITVPVTGTVLIGGIIVAALGSWLLSPPAGPFDTSPSSAKHSAPGTTVPFRGQVDLLVEREGKLLRLNEAGALPLRPDDKFRVEGRVSPPAYLYVIWVEPGHDITPVYPWDPEKGWGSRPAREEPGARVSLPPNAGRRYRVLEPRSGVATMVLFARPTPLDVPDETVRKWFEELPDLPLPAGGDQAAVWFDDYVEVRDPDRLRTFKAVEGDDPFARWQGELQEVLGHEAAFQTAVSFARTGGKRGEP